MFIESCIIASQNSRTLSGFADWRVAALRRVARRHVFDGLWRLPVVMPMGLGGWIFFFFFFFFFFADVAVGVARGVACGGPAGFCVGRFPGCVVGCAGAWFAVPGLRV